VADYLRMDDLFVMSFLWEGLSIAFLETAGFGLPIVATNVGGNSEIIKDNKTGFLVEPTNSKELAERINYVLRLPEEKR
jgi:glycosyltransferase involved in cell wall biosynthesis